MLDEFGVDFIEAGMPAQSKQIKEAVKKIAGQKLGAEIMGHARARREDIDAVIDCNCDWAGIFMGINELSLEHKYHKTKAEVINMIVESIIYAKDNGLKVRYTVEDATRTDLKDLIGIARLAKKAGADVLSLADTTGTISPEKFYNVVSKLKKEVAIDLEVHCHNDFGLALANSLAAYRAGAKIVDACVNGLGERAGLTPLQELCVALKLIYKEKNSWKLEKLPAISRIVEKFSGIKADRLRPITGENAFTHTADLHVKAIKNEPKCYEAINPKIVGRKRKFTQ